MLCYKGISCSLSRLRFRFATSAVSVDVLYIMCKTNNFFCIFLTFSQKILLSLRHENEAYERHSCKSVVIPL